MKLQASRMVLASVLLTSLTGATILLLFGGSNSTSSSLKLRTTEDSQSSSSELSSASASSESRELRTQVVVLDYNNLINNNNEEDGNENDDDDDDLEMIDDDGPVQALEEKLEAASSNLTNATNATLDELEEEDDWLIFETTNTSDFHNTTTSELVDSSTTTFPIEEITNTTNSAFEDGDEDEDDEDMTVVPTTAPTFVPSPTPTADPTASPSPDPTMEPTSGGTPTASPSASPTIEPFGPIDYVGNDASGFYAPYPLGVCQGDCDTDDDCADGLYCYQRGAFQSVPGCTGGNRYASTADFCVWNASLPRPPPATKYNFGEFDYVGNDGTWYAVYPLPVCKGDCDSDDDCAEGLFCYNRNPNDGIPGCTGGQDDATTADVCVWNTSFPMPKPNPEPPLEAFRLKLYWQEGYLWQNETFEREWCMSHDYDGYPGTGGCWYARDFLNCSLDSLYMALCIDADPRQWFTFVDLGTLYNDVDEILIKTMGDGPSRCFTRRQSAIYLDSNCNPNDPTQRFFALRGSFTGYRFELGQYQGYTLDNCISNEHHPKSGEILSFHICDEVRKEHDETSFWEYF